MNYAYLYLKALILPPGILLVLGITGFFLWYARPKLARWLIGLSFAAFFLLSTKIVADTLTSLVMHPVVEPATLISLVNQEDESIKPEAIVVIAAGTSEYAPEYGGNTVNEFTLVRIRYAAYLHQQLGLPVLVSGGGPYDRDTKPEAVLMRRTLKDGFQVEPKWVEPTSQTTWENAQNSAKILQAEGISNIILVTQALHMPRSAATFEKAGFTVTPAPTGYYSPPHWTWDAFLPSAQGFHQSRHAIYEMYGRILYAFKN